MKPKDMIRLITPPILWCTLRKLRAATAGEVHLDPKTREWEYIPEGWAYAETHPEYNGWNVPDILAVYKRKWSKFVAMTEGIGPLGIAQESDLITDTDINSHNTIISFAYAIALCAHRLESLSMLDWGGGIGHYYLLARALLPEVRIEYHCKDVAVLAEYGASLFPEQQFYTDESCLQRTYDFVMASTSLHYSEDWPNVLAGLARAAQGYLYITRLPTVIQAASFVFIQRPYAYGYNTEYLGWCLNRNAFLNEAVAMGLRVVREFIIAESPSIANAPEGCQYRGFLFQTI